MNKKHLIVALSSVFCMSAFCAEKATPDWDSRKQVFEACTAKADPLTPESIVACKQAAIDLGFMNRSEKEHAASISVPDWDARRNVFESCLVKSRYLTVPLIGECKSAAVDLGYTQQVPDVKKKNVADRSVGIALFQSCMAVAAFRNNEQVVRACKDSALKLAFIRINAADAAPVPVYDKHFYNACIIRLEHSGDVGAIAECRNATLALNAGQGAPVTGKLGKP